MEHGSDTMTSFNEGWNSLKGAVKPSYMTHMR
jgi:hypothetical protein